MVNCILNSNRVLQERFGAIEKPGRVRLLYQALLAISGHWKPYLFIEWSRR
jgi:hypothetical protein